MIHPPGASRQWALQAELLGKSLGRGIRAFKGAIVGGRDEEREEDARA